jgi:hypothetical protein
MTTTAVVLFQPVQHFNECTTGYQRLYPEIRYLPPRGGTLDPRYAACTKHWVACDCREAHMAEDRAEIRAHITENRRYGDAVRAVLTLHRRNLTGNCSMCFAAYPCPTRNLLAPTQGCFSDLEM